jgi:hypothetical protein
MSCCQNSSSNSEIAKEKVKVSWKMIVAVIFILALLLLSSLSLMRY